MTDAAGVVRRYLVSSTAGDVDAAAALLAPDVRIWVSGRLAISGHRSIAQYRRSTEAVRERFPDGYHLHIEAVLADGDQVAVRARGEGSLGDGKAYTPSYAMFFEVHDGRIAAIREYLDTEYVANTFRVPVGKS